MRDYPPFADRGRRERGEHGYEKHQRHETAAYLWIATATVLILLAVLLLFSRGDLRNGGAPFVITPPSQVIATPIDER